MTTENKKPNTTVPRDEAALTTPPVEGEESETTGREVDPNTTVPRDNTASDTTVRHD
jgi:hypothetical protein